MEDVKRPIAPSSGIDEDIGSSTEKENEREFSRHEDTESISKNSADLSCDCFVADSHVSTVSS